jgi:ABC-type molybdate transport system, periplasmic component
MRTVVFAIICALSTHVFATTITVFAPASLKTVVDELTMMFETQSPDQKIRVSFAGSSVLARQIIARCAPLTYTSQPTRNWIDHVEAKGRVLPQSRQTLVNIARTSFQKDRARKFASIDRPGSSDRRFGVLRSAYHPVLRDVWKSA